MKFLLVLVCFILPFSDYAYFSSRIFGASQRIKQLLPNIRIYAYAYKKRLCINTDVRIYAGNLLISRNTRKHFSASASQQNEVNDLWVW